MWQKKHSGAGTYWMVEMSFNKLTNKVDSLGPFLANISLSGEYYQIIGSDEVYHFNYSKYEYVFIKVVAPEYP